MTLRTYSGIACAALLTVASWAADPVIVQKTFPTPEALAEALFAAAETYDVAALKAIAGPDGIDLVVTDDPVLDKKLAAEFAAQARVKTQYVRDPKNPKIVTLVLGAENWPAPTPLIEKDGTWRFDAKAGRQEVLYRRIGTNELDAIDVCIGYVEAQHEYASEKRDGSTINQYAQRIISTPGKQDGLAWRTADGTWAGPVGEGIAKSIAEGYSDRNEPFHGYYYKTLKGQGPAAPMGEMNYVVKGIQIGGFALVAAPATYRVTGVKTFIVSSTGIVYQKDLGPSTLDQFRLMEQYNPDKTWTPVEAP